MISLLGIELTQMGLRAVGTAQHVHKMPIYKVKKSLSFKTIILSKSYSL